MSVRVRCHRIFLWKQFIACGVFAFSACLLVSFPVHADQVGVVFNTPAYIYEKADFDSKIISELGPDSKVRISTKKWGAFFRTQTAQGGIGYVSDGDVKPTNGKLESLKPSKTGNKKNSKSTGKTAETPPAKTPRGPWWTAGMLGVQGEYVQYSEIVAKLQYSETETNYGLKFSFPFRLIDGPVHMDLNLLAHLATPSFYSGISSTPPTGFYIALDAPLLFTLGTFWRKSGAIYAGAGPLFIFSNYTVTLNTAPAQLEALRIGAVVELGVAFELGSKLALKIEPRYNIEQQSYWAALASLQLLL